MIRDGDDQEQRRVPSQQRGVLEQPPATAPSRCDAKTRQPDAVVTQ